jgi:pimeloyl-ACP methyl ester carboxylesterase
MFEISPHFRWRATLAALLATPVLLAGCVAITIDEKTAFARLFVRPEVVPSLAAYDVVAQSARVTGPILVLGAGRDEVLPVTLARDVAQGLGKLPTKLTYREFPGATHQSVPYQPDFAQTLNRFFQSVESAQ